MSVANSKLTKLLVDVLTNRLKYNRHSINDEDLNEIVKLMDVNVDYFVLMSITHKDVHYSDIHCELKHVADGEYNLLFSYQMKSKQNDTVVGYIPSEGKHTWEDLQKLIEGGATLTSADSRDGSYTRAYKSSDGRYVVEETSSGYGYDCDVYYDTIDTFIKDMQEKTKYAYRWDTW